MEGFRGVSFSLRHHLKPAPVALVLDRLLGLRSLERDYRSIPPSRSPDDFLRHALDRLGVRIDVSDEDLLNLPGSGPAVVVANHPYGGIEGVALALLLRSLRGDVRILANYILGRIPELAELLLLVDPFDTSRSARHNVAAMRAAIRWVTAGGVLVVFPAGEVAHLELRSMSVTDPPWSPKIARIVRRSGAPVVPVYFDGHNGPLFQIAGLIHPFLRTVLLPRQLLKRRGTSLPARVGRPVPSERLRRFNDDLETIEYLRRRTEILAERRPAAEAGSNVPVQPRRNPTPVASISDPLDPEVLADEVAALPAERLLVDEGDRKVLVANAREIPNVLREIGRLRELSFRNVGEGTGRELDLDRFDVGYEHLFVWQAERNEIVGAYRICRTDDTLFREGIGGLYTATLFRYSRRLFEAMGPALELGRSFVRPEYQKSFSSLALLWKGIGRYVLRHPRYTTLFGPVSISADYRLPSQQLIVSFLKQNSYTHDWSRWVRPLTPLKSSGSQRIRIAGRELRHLEDVSALISEIENDHKGVPILLRQYLKLGGRLLGFNVDPNFSNVLDVLLMVDLTRTEERVLTRYLGREGAELLSRRQQQLTDSRYECAARDG
jgi:putative hemolysin